jgi:hypothetical protein
MQKTKTYWEVRWWVNGLQQVKVFDGADGEQAAKLWAMQAVLEGKAFTASVVQLELREAVEITYNKQSVKELLAQPPPMALADASLLPGYSRRRAQDEWNAHKQQVRVEAGYLNKGRVE